MRNLLLLTCRRTAPAPVPAERLLTIEDAKNAPPTHPAFLRLLRCFSSFSNGG